MTNEAGKDVDSIRKMTDNPPSEELISEILLEDELLAEEMRRSSFSARDSADAQINTGELLEDAPSPAPTGGDLDADPDLASTVGEEAVGGTTPTPGQTDIDGIAASAGVEMDDREDQYASEMLNTRDDRRWELEPKSSEDYQDRRE